MIPFLVSFYIVIQAYTYIEQLNILQNLQEQVFWYRCITGDFSLRIIYHTSDSSCFHKHCHNLTPALYIYRCNLGLYEDLQCKVQDNACAIHPIAPVNPTVFLTTSRIQVHLRIWHIYHNLETYNISRNINRSNICYSVRSVHFEDRMVGS